MSMRLTKKIIAMCFAVGMTLMPMGQAFANEEGETLVESKRSIVGIPTSNSRS